jgi:hypothetical protein
MQENFLKKIEYAITPPNHSMFERLHCIQGSAGDEKETTGKRKPKTRNDGGKGSAQ